MPISQHFILMMIMGDQQMTMQRKCRLNKRLFFQLIFIGTSMISNYYRFCTEKSNRTLQIECDVRLWWGGKNDRFDELISQLKCSISQWHRLICNRSGIKDINIAKNRRKEVGVGDRANDSMNAIATFNWNCISWERPDPLNAQGQRCKRCNMYNNQ